ncbi:MAG: hypothetical protein ACAI38_21140 [Myxococcota bacterium]
MADKIGFPGARATPTNQGVDLDTDFERDGVQINQQQVDAFRRMPNPEADRFLGTLTRASAGALEAAFDRDAMTRPPGQRTLLRDRVYSEVYRRFNEGQPADQQVRRVRVGATDGNNHILVNRERVPVDVPGGFRLEVQADNRIMLSRTDGRPFRGPVGAAEFDHVMLEPQVGGQGVRFDYSAGRSGSIESGGVADLNAYLRSLGR